MYTNNMTHININLYYEIFSGVFLNLKKENGFFVRVMRKQKIIFRI